MVDTIYEVEASDVDLSSFKVREELNQDLWNGETLRRGVRHRLLDISDDFIDTLETPWVKVKDVVFTGSLANYNWSRYSDIDLHIVINFKDVWEKRTDFVKDYFDAKKNEWAAEHDNIKIYGFPVEISVEDEGEPSKSTGVYSLKSDKWMKKPKDLSDSRINHEYVKETSAKFMTEIDNIIKKVKKAKSPSEKWKTAEGLLKIFDKLKKLRKSGLESKAKEMSSGNIIWKTMRREGYINDIWDTVNSAYDMSVSLK